MTLLPNEKAARFDGLVDALRKIAEGSEFNGRWLDENANETTEDAEGAAFVLYDVREQDAWLEDVARLAKDALAKAGVPFDKTEEQVAQETRDHEARIRRRLGLDDSQVAS